MQRDGSGRFLPGQSANPGGRPSGVKELRELTRQYTHEAVDVLVKHLNDPDPRVALFAANSLLDRGYGKPSPAAEEDQTDLARAHLEALKAITARSERQHLLMRPESAEEEADI
jgi:hypothetical protein